MKKAFTLLELLVVVTLIGIGAGIAIPRVRGIADSFAVEGATRETINVFALARLAALRHGGAEILIDSATLTLRAAGHVLHQRNIVAGHGVQMRTSMTRVQYAATGIGVGVSNGTIYLSRGASADTVVISRLGRVRR